MNPLAEEGFPALAWRALESGDFKAIRELIATCLAVDGGLYFAAKDPLIQQLYAPLLSDSTLGGFDGDGHLVACAGVKPSADPDEDSTATAGMVHPDWRRRGLGSLLLTWSIEQASAQMASARAGDARTLYLSTESLTDDADRLYLKNGFVLAYASDVMSRKLDHRLPEAAIPEGTRVVPWRDELALDFFQVYQAAFRERPGFPGWSAQEWIARQTEDEEFSPEWSLLAYADEQPVGFIVCFDNFVGQMGVHPDWRNRGMASALLVESMQRSVRAGGSEVWLNVNINNPKAARVYTRLGFEFAGRRARYKRSLA